jgi:hypothetical protein
MAQLEVAIAEVDDAEPGRVTLLASSNDPRLVRIVRDFFAGTWPAVVPLPQAPPGITHLGDRRTTRGERKK